MPSAIPILLKTAPPVLTRRPAPGMAYAITLLAGLCLASSLLSCAGWPDDDASSPSPEPLAVQIVSPAAGTSFRLDQTIQFYGYIVTEAASTNAEFLWSSNLEGALGQGEYLARPLTVAGLHTITLDARDLDRGLMGSATVEIEVLASSNRSPVAQIYTPTEGAQLLETDPVLFSGVAIDAEDGPLQGAALTWISSRQGALGQGEQLTVSGLAPGEHLITLNAIDNGGASGAAFRSIEVYGAEENRPPIATITLPEDHGATVSDALVRLVGSASDAEDGLLTGAALQWSSSIDGPLGEGDELLLLLGEGFHRMTLTAADALGATDSDTVSFSVNPVGSLMPTVEILSPSDGSVLQAGAQLLLVGAADDPDVGPLTGAGLQWYSSLDGRLGEGETLLVPLSTPGRHDVILVATDTEGASASTQVSVRVLESTSNLPPQVEITEPSDGTVVMEGEPITFAATAGDGEDGPLPEAAQTWTSSLDGPLGTGSSLTLSALSAGTHLVTFTAVDSGALSAQDTVSVRVVAAPLVDAVPTAVLVGPRSALEDSPIFLDARASSDAENGTLHYRFEFGDGSVPQEGSDPTATHSFAVPGLFTLTLTVEDPIGQDSVVQHSIEIRPASSAPVALAEGEPVGRWCSLAFSPSDLPVIAYDDAPGRSVLLLYGQSDGSFEAQPVPDPVGSKPGRIGQQVALALDANGALHLIYRWIDGEDQHWLRYATRTGDDWFFLSLDRLRPGLDFPELILSLDRASSDQPTILYSPLEGQGAALQTCTGDCSQPGSWMREILLRAPDTDPPRLTVPGGLQLDSSGSGILSFADLPEQPEAGGEPASMFVMEHRPDTTWSSPEEIVQDSSRPLQTAPALLRLQSPGQTWIAFPSGLVEGLEGNYTLRRTFDPALERPALDFDPQAREPVLAWRREGHLVLQRPAQTGWVYDDLGVMDETWPALVMRPDGIGAVCFHSSSVLYYVAWPPSLAPLPETPQP